MILNCSCNHPSQDKLHGPNKRVHNQLTVVSGSIPTYRCTVCLTVRRADNTEVMRSKK